MKRRERETFDNLVTKQLKHYARFFKDKHLRELVIEENGFKTTLCKEAPSHHKEGLETSTPSYLVEKSVSTSSQSLPDESPSPKDTPSDKEDVSNKKQILSPITGTFYASPSPSSPPYVQVGDTVSKNKIICIVEAMKNMNEIKAEVSGKVTDILVENGQAVAMGDVLIILD